MNEETLIIIAIGCVGLGIGFFLLRYLYFGAVGLFDEQDARDKDQAKCAELEAALRDAFTRITWYREKYPEAETGTGKRLIH
jgi:hypothetical protein